MYQRSSVGLQFYPVHLSEKGSEYLQTACSILMYSSAYDWVSVSVVYFVKERVKNKAKRCKDEYLQMF